MVICLVALAATAAAVGVGVWLGQTVSETIGFWVQVGLLLLIGCYMMGSAVRKMSGKKKRKKSENNNHVLRQSARVLGDPAECDSDDSKSVDGKEAVAIGLAVSADSMAVGLGVGMSGGLVFLLPVFCAVFQLVFFWVGEKLARKLQKLTGLDDGPVEFLVGLILAVMGFVRLLG